MCSGGSTGLGAGAGSTTTGAGGAAGAGAGEETGAGAGGASAARRMASSSRALTRLMTGVFARGFSGRKAGATMSTTNSSACIAAEAKRHLVWSR